MRVAWLPRTLLASLVVVVVVLCAGLAPSPAAATEEPPAETDAATITTTLYPGWNMVGWVGPETPASELFDELPALGRIFAWDAEEQRYLRLMPSSGSMGDEHLLTPGDGLWLYIGGTSPVEWTREASEDSVLLDLRAGPNLVAWAGRDGTPVGEATVRFGDRLELVWAWSAEAQEYRLYHPSAGLDQVQELSHGDALLVEVSEDGRWWQSGTAPTPVEIVGEYTEEERAEIRRWVDGNRGLFAERWGVEARVQTYAGDRASLAPVYERVTGWGMGAWDGIYSSNERAIFLASRSGVHGIVHAHEYFHAIQHHLMETTEKPVPAWIIEGSATYAGVVFGVTPFARMLYPRWGPAPPTIEAGVQQSMQRARLDMHGYWPSLSETEGGPVVTGRFPREVYYDLGFLGIAWLAEHSGDQSVVEFWRHLADKPNWQEAFEAAFGMTSGEFDRRFDAYRAERVETFPHRLDRSDEPVIEFMDDVPEQTRAAFDTELDRVRRFLSGEFGSGPVDYTLYVTWGRDAANEAHNRVFGTDEARFSCTSQLLASAMIINARCYRADPALVVVRSHFELARALAGGVRIERGPPWLLEGAESYVTARYLHAQGTETLESRTSRERSSAERTKLSLQQLELPHPFQGSQAWEARAVSFLAVERLLEHAGDASLFDYYRSLDQSPRWEDAFETAFGLKVGDFYEQFEAYRARVAPPAGDAGAS